MSPEKEFSFAHFFKFTMRYFLVGVLFVALGLGIGATTSFASKKTNYEKYTGSMTLNVANYAAVSGINTADNTVLSSQIQQIMEAAGSASVKSQAFATLQQEIYPDVGDNSDKLKLFNSNLTLSSGTNSLTVSFIYDVTADTAEAQEKNRQMAKTAISTYLELAVQAVREQYPVLANNTAFSQVFTISRIQPSYDLSESILESNKGVSVLKRAALGGILGGVLAAMLIFALYLFDPRIKCVQDILPFEKSTALRAEDENAVVKLMARVKVAQAKRIAVLSLSKDELYDEWTAKLVEYLKKSGANVKAVTFKTESTEWLSYFQASDKADADYELYFYNDDATGIASYIASNADLSAFFIDQREVMAKTLQTHVESISNNSYNCTIIHNTDRAYVG